MDSTRLEEIRQSELGLEFFPLARLEKNELLGHIDELTTKLDDYRKQFAEDQARINTLAAQVAMLRGLLEPTDDVWEHNIDEDGCHRRGKCERCEARRIALADTETATTAWLEAHDREQRLTAIKFAKQVPIIRTAEQVLEAMEREQ